jgi:hypothetical protein
MQRMELDALREQVNRYQALADQFIAWLAQPKPVSIDPHSVQAVADQFKTINDALANAFAQISQA